MAMVYREAPGALAAGVVGALLLAFALYRGVPPTRGMLWLMLCFFATLLVFCLWVWHKRSRPDPAETQIWARRMNIAILLLGLSWGAAGIILFENDYTRQLMLAFALLLV
ncbi:MAG: hypothetical protein M3Q00_01795, partial [Pseudomonadota bacterium]|nr:hypothetical protein [Pseudomonadota bacterium]